ncbi:helix-turn-helix domain-containing protein [Solidesulfovibrio alcoholivorans]|uniref:helix-turn-helix domain-containing protein n=1 Tax=Solidesulfovibrio alcoholivorans TaxID=81406 RepID=UPI0004962F1D|nr:helix-turn-helix transcriptional regulator [Solidesulfovibrio alcoholivorans]
MQHDDTPGRPETPAEVAWLRRDGFSAIRAWREHLGVSREELALRLGVSPPAVAQFEAAKARPRAAMLKKVAAALGISWELLREDG